MQMINGMQFCLHGHIFIMHATRKYQSLHKTKINF